MVDVINRKYTDSRANTYDYANPRTTINNIDHLIASISFYENIIVIKKIDKEKNGFPQDRVNKHYITYG
jgi:hypothetical protein